MIKISAFVGEYGKVAQYIEAVCKTFRNLEHILFFAVQNDSMVFSECGGIIA